jgi:hypothetical protein
VGWGGEFNSIDFHFLAIRMSVGQVETLNSTPVPRLGHLARRLILRGKSFLHSLYHSFFLKKINFY